MLCTFQDKVGLAYQACGSRGTFALQWYDGSTDRLVQCLLCRYLLNHWCVSSAWLHFTSVDVGAECMTYCKRPAKQLRLALARSINVTAYETRTRCRQLGVRGRIRSRTVSQAQAQETRK